FQAEDGIRDFHVTGVQTCALPIFEPQDMHNVLHGEEWFMVKGTMETPNGSDELSCAVRKGHRKVFTRNRKEYERLADHVGRFPRSEERRVGKECGAPCVPSQTSTR